MAGSRVQIPSPLPMDKEAFMNETCHMVGISGGCGAVCPVYRRGDCDKPPEPYVFVCVDSTGVSLTEGKSYPLVSKGNGFLVVRNDEGEEKEFFESRFDLEEEALETV